MEAPAAPIVVGEIPHGPVTPGIMASIQQAINEQIPDDKHGVLLEVTGAEGQPVAFGVAAKLPHGWQLAGDLEMREAWKPVAGTVSVAWMW